MRPRSIVPVVVAKASCEWRDGLETCRHDRNQDRWRGGIGRSRRAGRRLRATCGVAVGHPRTDHHDGRHDDHHDDATHANSVAAANPGADHDARARAAGRPLSAFLIAVDPKASTVKFDVVQFLTGAQADEAYRRDHPGGDSAAPNGYYIVNANPLLRTLPVRAGAVVVVLVPPLGGTDTKTITLAELPGYFASMSGNWGTHLWPNPFWLTVRNGAIVALQEQFLP